MRDGVAGALAGTLVEREQEITSIGRALDEAAAGRGHLVVVAGPTGIGKTRLLAEAERLAGGRQAEVLRALGSEYETDLPFGLVLQIFERRLVRASSAEVDLLLAGAAGRCRLLLEEGTPPSGDLQPVVHALYWLVVNLSEQRPLAIVVDDAHLGDEPSLRLLGYLATRLRDLPVTVVVGTRTDIAAGRSLLDRLAEGPSTAVIRPRELSDGGVAEVIRQRFGVEASPRFSAACHVATGGNPFLLHAVASDLLSTGTVPGDDAAARLERVAPTEVLVTIGRRLKHLSEEARSLAVAVAVLGEHAEPQSLAAVAGLEPLEVAAGLDELRAGGLLAPSEQPAFAHAVVRTSLLSDLGRAERLEAHERALATLREQGGRVELLAPHVLEVPPRGDPVAVAALRAAARRALASGSPESADTYLRRALAEPPSTEKRAGLLAECAHAAGRAGRGDAEDLYQQAIEATDDTSEITSLRIALARHVSRSGQPERAVALLEQVDASLALADARRLRIALVEMSRFVPARRLAARAALQEFVDRSHGPITREERRVLALAAYESAISSAEPSEARRLATRALADGPRAATLDLGSVPLFSLALALAFIEDFAAADALYDEAVADARRRGSYVSFARASAWRARHHLNRGRLEAAVADADAAFDADDTGEASLTAVAPLTLAELARGDLPAARAAIDRAGPEERRHDPGLVGQLHARAMVHAAEGRLAEALDELLACGRFQEQVGATNAATSKWRSNAASVAHRLGRADLARTLAGEELELNRVWGAPRSLGISLLAAAETRVCDPEDALDEAVELLGGAGDPVTYARALLARGRLFVRTDSASARSLLEQGLELAHRQGALELASALTNELIAVGGTAPKRSRATTLTPSEDRVARLAASGLTNREIAEQSFVTLSAVEFHLRNVYRKLGIGGRRELRDALPDRTP